MSVLAHPSERDVMTLHRILDGPVAQRPSHPAVVEGNGGGRIDYATLNHLSDRVRDRLAALGVQQGDRVGMYLRKSCDGVATIFGILKAGAAYVPVDPTAPASRNAYIHENCSVRAVIVERRFEAAYREEYAKLGPLPPIVVLDSVGAGQPLQQELDALDASSGIAPEIETRDPAPDDLAYILYTSGSTGKPKGVMLSHRNAVSFVDWCSDVFQPQPSDVFSSHAPFHFDLSILDLYVPLKHGATLVLIDEKLSKDPAALSKVISDYHITVWYSAPSILSLIGQFGKISEHDFSSLRIVLFAGEVFPIPQLRLFKKQVPEPRYFNLYGPTETNVCTYYEVPEVIPDDRMEPYPIGVVCENLRGRVIDLDGKDVARGAEGELCITGPNVMGGYWGLAEMTAKGFIIDEAGERWYKTGDIVVEQPDGNYKYVGRRDRMVKKRGYRVELGEIEACLYRHADIREAGVVALQDSQGAVFVKAHLSMRDERKPSLIELKTFCSKHLPVYMVPDAFAFHETLPKTSTDKIDYQTLKTLG
jgi:amino acid adenylation domain-containing protein